MLNGKRKTADGIYLDYAAATPMDPQVLKAMEPYFTEKFYNPSAVYLPAQSVRYRLEQAREDIAGCLGARPAEIVFTAGATEANNLAIQGVMKRHPDGEILVGATEHESVLEPAKLFKHRLIPVDKQGVIDVDRLSKMITKDTAMVSVGLVNNETGTLQPLAKIVRMLNPSTSLGAGKRILLHTDAAQAPNCFDIHVSRLGVDMMSINGGKIYGPKQSGALYIKAGIELEPLIYGGGQESGLRSGTENVAAAAGLAAALSAAQASRKEESARLDGLRAFFIESLTKKLPRVMINGSPRAFSPHIVSVTFPGADNERLMMQLDEAGIQAAVGSACSAADTEPSHVLSAMGLSGADAHSTLRFSFGRQTTEKDIRQTVEILNKLSN
jgi:cysteine desulfurase